MMRTIAMILSVLSVLSASGQTPDGSYAARWKKIDQLINENGLTRSALAEVEKVYQLAKKEKKDVQIIKALIYMARLDDQLKEESDHGLNLLISELKTAKAPVKQLLHSMLAAKYQNYLEANRFRLYGRTPLNTTPGTDPDTWSLEELHHKISLHYQASLTQTDILKKTRLEPFDPIIVKGNSRTLRPTLFDLLAHQALDYFGNDERDISKPAYRFAIDDPKAFAPAREFSGTTFKTSDTSSLNYLALRTYQQLLAFHLADKEPSALLDADLGRLAFTHRASVLPEKDRLYLEALDQMQKNHPNHPFGVLAGVINLEKQHQDAMSYRKGISTDGLKYALVGIRNDLEKITGRFPGSEADARARNLLTSIKEKTVSAKTELVVVPDKPVLALVSYRNIDAFHYRIVTVDEEENITRDMNQYWQKLTAKAPILKGKQTLPDAGDLREHRVEMAIEALPAGNYMLLASIREDFSMEGNDLTSQYFHVSNISHVNQDNHYFFLNRESGQPLPQAEVRVMQYRFNQQLGSPEYVQVALKHTNPDGYVNLHLPDDVRQFRLDTRWKNDRLYTNRNNYYRRYQRENDRPTQELTALFTDRSIYRPGQTVYFKGIKISRHRDGNQSTVIPDKKTMLRLYDANGQIRDSMALTTNTFGSYHGQFRLPENTLTGNFSIIDSDGNSSISFQVEEYKRPTFETVFDTVKDQLRLGDSVTATGTVKGYAGNTLNGTAIRYRVIRRTVMPWRWSYHIWPPARMEETEITHGETSSDRDGKFMIGFKALPDPGVSKDLFPVFHYEITVDVTDNSGETRSATKNLSISYHAAILSLDLEQEGYHTDSLKNIRVTATNAEGIPQKMAVEIIVYPLEANRRLLKERMWEVPDTSIMNRYDFSKLFPNDPYMDEADPVTWPKKEELFRKTGNTNEPIHLATRLEPGYYLIETIGKDIFGQKVKDMKYARIWDNKNDPFHPTYISTSEEKKKAEPGGPVSVRFGTSADHVFLIRQIDRRGPDSSLAYKVDQVGNQVKEITVPVLESDRGGFDIVHLFVKHNRFFQSVQRIDVPWTNKQLDISVETWRDKLLPGSRETWTIHVKGAKGEKIAAELLTSMYDASLDQFHPHQWYFPDIFRKHQSSNWVGITNFSAGQPIDYRHQVQYVKLPGKNYDAFQWIYPIIRHEDRMYAAPAMMNMQADGAVMEERLAKTRAMGLADTVGSSLGSAEIKPTSGPLSFRKNFNETAFFFPDLRTDEQGNISFSFTVPESLTRWKWQMLAHSTGVSTGMMTRELISQKELMVQPNMPRFLREGDKIRLSARVSNLSEKEITGRAVLQLIDPDTNQPVDGWFQNIFPAQYFTVDAKQTSSVQFEIEVPANYSKPLQYRITAAAGQHSDGEENILPVLSYRMLVTESQPILVRGNATKDYQLKGLIASANSNSITQHRLTLEYSTNPAWYAVLALPYLMEQRQECSEQLFNRLYANGLAALAANSTPAIQNMFIKWDDSTTLVSNLLKNPELRSVLLDETPWVLQAKNETEQRRNMGRLFNRDNLSSESMANLSLLREMQLANGSFPWFKGGMEDRYITQYIITGIGKLGKLKAVPSQSRTLLEQITANAMRYLDGKINEDYEKLVKAKTDLTKNNLGPLQVQYLYMRSFFKLPVPPSSQKAYDYYYNQAIRFWLNRSLISQGMIALVMNRTNNKTLASAIIHSLKENAIQSEELGMYWKANTRGYSWYQAPVETQALLMEAFAETGRNQEDIDNMKLWLLNQKRVQHWTSTKATADAVYAFMTTGTDLLGDDPEVTIQLGDKKLSSSRARQEAGTGYFTEVIGSRDIVPGMGNIKVDVKGNNATKKTVSPGNTGISWGAVHWQYFEETDKIVEASTPVRLTRQFLIERNSDKGPILTALKEGETLKVGDRIKIRITLNADRDMEYMHLKDMRVSGTEPIHVISSYKWHGGLGYYESTRDTGTEFFFSWLPKGTWVFEYPVVVTHTGHFAAGISTIQSMYAPEFNAHSGGSKLEVSE